MNERNPNDMQAIWQNQTVEPMRISLEELRKKAGGLQKRIFWRNLREYAAGAVVAAAFGYYMVEFHTPLVRLGCVLTIAGVLFAVYQLHKRGSSRAVPAEMAASTCLAFHRRELERQRDILRSVWSWYLLPFVPGTVVFLLGIAIEQSAAYAKHMDFAAVVFGVTGAAFVLGFFWIWKLNQWAAQKLQRQIDAFAALEKEPQ